MYGDEFDASWERLVPKTGPDAKATCEMLGLDPESVLFAPLFVKKDGDDYLVTYLGRTRASGDEIEKARAILSESVTVVDVTGQPVEELSIPEEWKAKMPKLAPVEDEEGVL